MTRRAARGWLRAFSALAAAFLLVGCGGSGQKKAAGPVTISIWEQMDPKEEERFQRHLQAYMTAHPGVKIENSHFNTEDLRSQFQNAANAGGGPDLVYGPSDQVGPFSVLKIITPIETLVPADVLAKFHRAAFDTLDGHIWALPDQIGNHLVLVYNRDLVAGAPADFEALMAEMKRQTIDENGDGTPDRFGIAFDTNEPFWLVPFISGFGGWVMDDQHQPTLATPAVVEALRLMAALKNDDKVMPRECNYQLMDTLFKEKKVAFIINGPWSWQSYIDAGMHIGLAPIPRINRTGLMPAPMSAAKGYSVNVNVPPDRKGAVVDLLLYLTSPEVEADFADLLILPSRLEALDSPTVMQNPLLAASRAAYDAGRRMPVVPEMRAIWDAMRPIQQAVMNGTVPPEAAAPRMQQDARDKIAAMLNQ